MNRKKIHRGMQFLSNIDEDFARGMGVVGVPEPRIRAPGFSTFFSTIISQQISAAAANTIAHRVDEVLGEITPETVLRVETERLREAGMSYRKIEYAQGLARAIVDGRFNPDALTALDDTEAIGHIVELRGFGTWSAEIYLMFSLQREDIFPADDLALRVALAKLKGLQAKPTPAQARKMIAHWSPWRSVGSLFLWKYYRGTPK